MIQFNDHQDFISKQKESIQIEKQAEQDEFDLNLKQLTSQELQQKGLALNNLKMKQCKIGLYGRTLVSFSHPQYKKDIAKESHLYEMCKLPNCKLQTGDSVSIFTTNNQLTNILGNGIIFRRSLFKYVITFDTFDEDSINNKSISIVQSVNDVTYKRCVKTLDNIDKIIKNNTQQSQIQLIQLLLYPNTHINNNIQHKSQIIQQSGFKNLNIEQQNAIQTCLDSKYISLIHGPPGTGKTSTICELIYQCVQKKQKILACAGSNLAVDNMVERLYKQVEVCRIGHPARMSQSVQINACLDYKIRQNSCYKEIQQLRKKIKDFKKGTDSLKQMKKDLQDYELICIKEAIENSQVVFCTNTGAMDRIFERYLPKLQFDVVIIDECAQSSEISCWMPILKGKKVILAGDHLQLPPTIKSNNKILQYTLFDRIQSEQPQFCTLLKEQYRMNEIIMNWSSQYVYDNQLKAAKSIQHHSLNDNVTGLNIPTLVFIDTAFCELGENIVSQNENQKSKFNEGESDLVNVVYDELKQYGILDQNIGVITPYNAQVNQIRKTLQMFYQQELEDLDISTVDGFQGREKDCIIISMVRSNPKKEVGFLSEFRRMNVAVTRAKKFIAIIGDSECVSQDLFLKNMIEYFQQYGDYRSAQEYKAQSKIQVRFQTGQFGQYINHNQQIENKQTDNKKIDNNEKKSKKEKIKKEKKKQIPQKEQQINQENQIKDNTDYGQFQSSQDLQLDQQFIQYKQQIDQFINVSNEKQILFSNLNSYQRKLIHDICDEKGINHQSIGNGKIKDIVIKKTIDNDNNIDQKLDKEKQQINDQKKQEKLNKQILFQEKQQKQIDDQKIKEKQDLDNQKIQQKQNLENQKIKDKQDFDKQNQAELIQNKFQSLQKDDPLDQQMKEYQQQKKQQIEQQKLQQEKQEQQQDQKKQQKKEQKKQKKKDKKQDKNIKEEDDDDFLDRMIQESKFCKYIGDEKKCLTKVEVMGIDCKYCGSRFCTQHAMPEKHGCGDDASIEARKKFQSQYQFNNQQGKNHKQLENSIKQKIDNLQTSRCQKKKDKKK